MRLAIGAGSVGAGRTVTVVKALSHFPHAALAFNHIDPAIRRMPAFQESLRISCRPTLWSWWDNQRRRGEHATCHQKRREQKSSALHEAYKSNESERSGDQSKRCPKPKRV